MYPLHKYLPTPFGTYLLYIDNGPTRVKVNKDRVPLPSYQAVKEYGRKQNQQNHAVSKYQAFQKPIGANASNVGKPVTAPPVKQERYYQRKKDAFTPASNMPTSIWSPKVKRKHLSYNMRQLWHTGQPVKDPPSKVIEVDEVTGAEVAADAQWYKGRPQKSHEEIFASPSIISHDMEARRQSRLSTRTENRGETAPQISLEAQKSTRSRLMAPPNSVANSPAVSEAYKRQASQLRHDMVPKRQRRHSRSRKEQKKSDQYYMSRAHKETQTTPLRSARTSMDYSDGVISPNIRGISNERSVSVPLSTPASGKINRTKDCMERTGLPPILETDAPIAKQEAKPIPGTTVTVETDTWRQRVRRVQEFRSASPTFPIKSKGQFWEEMNKNRMPNLPTTHNLLPFTWKEPQRHRKEEQSQQQRKLEVDKILPVITRMPSVPRV